MKILKALSQGWSLWYIAAFRRCSYNKNPISAHLPKSRPGSVHCRIGEPSTPRLNALCKPALLQKNANIAKSISQQSKTIQSLQIQEVPTSYTTFYQKIYHKLLCSQQKQVIQEILKLCYLYDWIEQLFTF